MAGEVILIQRQEGAEEEELRWREVVEAQDFVIAAAAVEQPADSIDSRRRSSGSHHKLHTDPSCRSIEHIERCSPMRLLLARPVPKDSWWTVAGIADSTVDCRSHRNHRLRLLHHRSDDRPAAHTLHSHDAAEGFP